MKVILLFLIKFYQIALSPFFGSSCRFKPTCSDYATQSIKKYGAYKGFALTCKRLIKCHPYHSGGNDPVP